VHGIILTKSSIKSSNKHFTARKGVGVNVIYVEQKQDYVIKREYSQNPGKEYQGWTGSPLNYCFDLNFD